MQGVACIALILLASAEAFFSVSYYGPEGAIVNTGAYFVEAPSADHIADIYFRLSGLPPILREGDSYLNCLFFSTKKKFHICSIIFPFARRRQYASSTRSKLIIHPSGVIGSIWGG
jgi:hypothetical protein